MLRRAEQLKVEVLPTAEALMRAAAEHFIASAADATRTSGRFTVALSGGSTPQTLYTLLATAPYRTRIDWSRVQLFWGDERCVPPDSPASNFRMVREALLEHVPVPADNIHRIRGEDDPSAAAAAYERELRKTFGTLAGPPGSAPGTRFDLVLLGMGDNGHTASLFPGTAAVSERERWVVAEYIAEVSGWRVTFTPIVINAAARVTFLVSGPGKAAMLHRVLEGPHDPTAIPAQVVAPHDGDVRWLVDAAAAAQLHRT